MLHFHEVTLHANIAKAVNICKQPIRLGYAIWANERHRQARPGYMFLGDLLDSYKVLYAGGGRSAIKDVIRKCDGIFWIVKGSRSGRKTISFMGPNRVLENLGIENRGRAILVEPHLLFNRKTLKRTLLEVSLMSKKGKGETVQVRMARDTIESITAIKPRTQRRWQEGQPRTYNFSGEHSINRDGDEYSPRQLGNTYYFEHEFKHDGPTGGPGFVDTTVRITPLVDAVISGRRHVVKRRTFYTSEKEAQNQAYALFETGEPDRLPVFLYKGKSAQGCDLWERIMFNGSRFITVGSELVLN